MHESKGVRVVEGSQVVPPGTRFALVASRFNAFVVERLVEGAIDALVRHGASRDHITVVRVPGSWELPLAVLRLAQRKRADAIVALGAVIRGETPHFEHVAAEATKGLAQVAQQTGVPVAFGVLTTNTLEQAVDRAGAKAGNKGAEAALAAVEMVTLLQALDRAEG